MDLTAASVFLTMFSPLLAFAVLLVLVLRSKGQSECASARDISKARVLVNISAGCGALALFFVLALFLTDKAGTEVLPPVATFAGILCIPRLLWVTKWRQRATDITTVISFAMVVPFISFWPLVISLASLLLVAGSLLRAGSGQFRH